MHRYNRNVTRRDFMLCAATLGLTPNLATVALPIASVAKTAARSQDLAPKVPAAPALVFTDITQQAGLTMKIVDGGKSTVYLTDVNGEGAGFLDYNNDGYMDIYLVNGSLPKAEGGGQAPHDYLLRNNGDGTFTDVTAQAHLGAAGLHSGCAVGDYNNDGWADIYVTGFGPNLLYRNNGDGTFTEVAGPAHVADPHWDYPKWSMGAAWGDYDNDGNLDLYVANFAQFDLRNPPPKPGDLNSCKLMGVPIACPPDNFPGEQGILYHNNGDGTFTDVTQQAGLARGPGNRGRGFGVVFGDFNNRGLQDIYQVNDSGPNFFYINNGNGTFKDASFESGLAVDGLGNPQGTMGVTVGDYNNDGLMDIFIANWIQQNQTLYENLGSHIFQDSTSIRGIAGLGYEYCAWGTKFVDFDNDGWEDLWITFGHTDPQVEKVHPNHPFAEPNYLLRNMHGKTFVDVSKAVGLRNLKPHSGRGAAFADIDNDGDVDVLIVNKNDVPTLLRNDGGNRNNWMVIRTEGVRSNRMGIGARITVTAGGKPRIFDVRTNESYLSSNDPRVFVGMAKMKQADQVMVRWPSGHVDRFSNVRANTFYLAVEGGKLTVDPRVKNPQKPLN